MKKAGFLKLLLVSAIVCASAHAETAAPQQAVETFISAIRSMQFPAKDEAKQSKLVAKADSFLDLDAMSKKALAGHWNEAAPEEQKTFLSLMWKLIEQVAYPRSGKFMGDYEITYPEVRKAADHFHVHSVVKQQEEALNAGVVYYLHEKDGQWKIDDIILDDVSIAEDLKYQFDKLVKDSGFTGLLNKMRERLAEAEKENAGKNQAGKNQV